MNPIRCASLALAILSLAACSKAPTPTAAPTAAVVPPPAAASAADAPQVPLADAPPNADAPPKELQKVAYACGDGSTLLLRVYDDERARIDVEGREQVLRPVPTEDGTLFLGDEVNLRVIGKEATLSRDGVVLKTACKYRPAA